MSIERALLEKWVKGAINYDLIEDTKDLLAQPEQDAPEYEDGPEFEGWEKRSGKFEQEPVAWIDVGSLKGLQESTGYALRYLTNDIDNLKPTDVPLYLAPPTRKPLSEYEITEACLLKGQDYVSAFIDGVEFAEKHYRITGVDDGH